MRITRMLSVGMVLASSWSSGCSSDGSSSPAGSGGAGGSVASGGAAGAAGAGATGGASGGTAGSTATGGSAGSGGTGGSGGAAGSGGSAGTGGSGGAGGSAPPGKLQMTVDGKFLQADGSFVLSGSSNGAGAYFSDGSNTSVGFTGTAAGTYDSAGGKVSWIFNGIAGQWKCSSAVAGSSCSVTVTTYGPNPGDHEVGTFSGTLVKQSGTGPDTVTVTAGSYDLTGS
jgi:hypothetical protein